MKRIVRRMAMASAALVFLTACSSSASKEDQGNQPDSSLDSAAMGEWPQASFLTEVPVSFPLSHYAPFLEAPRLDEEHEKKRAEWAGKVGDSIAQCMKGKGFLYYPQEYEAEDDISNWTLSVGSLPVPLLPEDRSSAESYGYGLYPTPEVLHAELLEAQANDRNLQYMESLPLTSRAAYEEALYGKQVEGIPITGGCAGAAMDSVQEPEMPQERWVFYENFGDLIFMVQASIGEEWFMDPRVSTLNSEWYECMATKGFGFHLESPNQGPNDALDQAFRTFPDGSVDWNQLGVLTHEIPDEAKSLIGSEPELIIAAADFDCRAKTDYIARAIDIRISRDEEFISQHKLELINLENRDIGG
ncbi:MAG: hypothetical protein FWG15_04970 [Propionibacteriaceae bacterium]|nr:hypothetical protein [Propionibacteriaceae bacterium]